MIAELDTSVTIFGKELYGYIENEQKRKDVGVGILIGSGFAIPMSAGTRMLFHFNYALRSNFSNEGTVKNLSFSVGWLF